MKVAGLITEYNPFHNGHLYHIEEAKRLTGADIIIAVMSGNFVQRGTPALIDKYSRTLMALNCGADIVLELPVCYSTASAEYFALGAVSLLEKLGIVDFLVFGSECGDIEQLTSIAKILTDDNAEYNRLLNSYLCNGLTFPAARMKTIKTVAPYLNDALLASPNNILGVEYLKALHRLNSNICPVTISRKESGYHETELSKSGSATISSATAIRKTLLEKETLDNLKTHVPEPVFNILKDQYQKTFPIYEDDCSLLTNYKLMQETKQSLALYNDISSDLASRINNTVTEGLSFSHLTQTIKSRQWTLTRINRALIHILLNLYQNNFETYNISGYTQYARILGLRKSSSYLLREVTSNNSIPVITKLADAQNQLSDIGAKMLEEDIFAAHLYNQIIFHKFGTLLPNEYKRGIILF